MKQRSTLTQIMQHRTATLANLLKGAHFNDFEGSKSHYEAAIHIDPNDALAHRILANLLKEAHFNDFEESKSHYEAALHIDPNDALAHYGLAKLLEGAHFNDFEGSKHHYKEALRLNMRNDAQRRYAEEALARLS